MAGRVPCRRSDRVGVKQLDGQAAERLAASWLQARGLRIVERNYRSSRRPWTILVSGFFEPVFFLFAMGVGIGALVGDVTTDDGVLVPYAVFVAPALLAASAMNGAVFDSTTNVFFKLKYARLYDSVLATPLGPRDVAVGEMNWLATPPVEGDKVAVQIRHRGAAATATVDSVSDDRVGIRFEEPQRAAAPGQSAVVFAGEVVLGGGRIAA